MPWPRGQGCRQGGPQPPLETQGLMMRLGLPGLGASRVQARWAPAVLSCSPSPTLTHLSLSHLPSPSHPTRGSYRPTSSQFLCVFPAFSHVCAAPEVGAVPLGQPAPPLLSVWSGPQPPAQLSLGQERHVSCAPGGKGRWAGAKKWGAVLVVGGEEGYQPSTLPTPPTLKGDSKGGTGMNVCAFQNMLESCAPPHVAPRPCPPPPAYNLFRHSHTLLLTPPNLQRLIESSAQNF